MKHIQVYENFQEGPMRKEPNIFQKAWKGARELVGIENPEDRKSLETIHRYLDTGASYGMVSNVKEIKPSVMVAWLGDRSLTVDSETPEILWKGKSLDLKNIQEETRTLFRKLIPFATETQMFGPDMQ
jgi:hypothetical protein